jgi:hypothetical protein
MRGGGVDQDGVVVVDAHQPYGVEVVVPPRRRLRQRRHHGVTVHHHAVGQHHHRIRQHDVGVELPAGAGTQRVPAGAFAFQQ